MGFLEAADLHLVKHRQGTGVGYLWFQAGAERSAGSQVFPMPWRETLGSILCCFSSVRTQGIAPEDEEQ